MNADKYEWKESDVVPLPRKEQPKDDTKSRAVPEPDKPDTAKAK